MSGSQRHSVAEVARILGISERGVRDRIEQGTLDAVKPEGQRGWRILLPPEAVVDAVAPTASSGIPSGSAAVGDAVVTPALVEAAIQRTGQQYTADLRVMLAELREVYEGQIAAKDAALAAKDETIAELRRRAEVAESALAQRREEEARTVELVRRRNEQERLNRERAQAAQDGPGATEGASADNPSDVPSAGFWARVRRVFGA